MDADFLRTCLFLYPDYPMIIMVDGEKKVLTSVHVDSENKEIIFNADELGPNRDLT